MTHQIPARRDMPSGGRPRPPAVGIVLQATGSHAWAVSRGWGNAVRALGLEGKLIAPRAAWGANKLDDDGGLAEYLAGTTRDDLVLLMGFDWHSQVLHRTWRWRRRVARARARKLLYVQESVGAFRELTGSSAMERAFRSAAELCDAVVYADLADRPLIESSGKPSLWQPFGVDDGVFRAEVPFAARARRAFFRGKIDTLPEYVERRRLLVELRARDLVDVLPYVPGEVDVRSLVSDFNRFQIALNLPSVFKGHPTRVLEAMACGCCVVTNRTRIPRVDGLFEEGREVVYYDGEAELVSALRRLGEDPATAAAIADSGRRMAIERYSLTRLLAQALAWVGVGALGAGASSP